MSEVQPGKKYAEKPFESKGNREEVQKNSAPLNELMKKILSNRKGEFVYSYDHMYEPLNHEIRRVTEMEREREEISKEFDTFFIFTGLNIIAEKVKAPDGERPGDIELVLVVDDYGKFNQWLSSINDFNFFEDKELFSSFVGLCHNLLGGIMRHYYYGENDDDFVSTIGSVSALNACIINNSNRFAVGVHNVAQSLQEMDYAIKGKYLPLYVGLERSCFGNLRIIDWEEKELDYVDNYFKTIRDVFENMYRKFLLETDHESDFTKLFYDSVDILTSNIDYVYTHQRFSKIWSNIKAMKEWINGFNEKLNQYLKKNYNE